MLLATLLLGCSEPRPQPWLDAEPNGQVLAGRFHAVVDSELPGSGWFAGDEVEGRDAARAFLTHPGGTDPVMVVQIYGRQGGAWDVLELDVPLAFWVAGGVPLDGHAGTGQLTLADGSQAVVVGGGLHIDLPGSLPGEPASAWFEDVELGVVP